MKSVVTMASNDKYSKIKYFKTLKELLDFMDEVKHPLIVSRTFGEYGSKEKNECEFEVMIYDDYIE
jgi:hypothetical protein